MAHGLGQEACNMMEIEDPRFKSLVAVEYYCSSDHEQPHLLNPLLSATAAGDMQAVQQQLAMLNAAAVGADDQGYTALHAAAQHGHTSIATLLLQRGAQVDAATADEQDTALHLATLHGDADIVQLLLEAGADANASDRDGCTALHIAAEAGSLQLVQLLLDAGADVDAEDGGGETPLILATHQGHTAVVQQLLAAGAAVDTACADSGFAALHHAAMQGHDDVLEELLSAAADAGQAATCKLSGGRTPLQLAAQFDQPEAVKQLLPTALGDADEVPAAHTGHEACPASAGLAAFCAAMQSGSRACMQVLLAAGALASAGDQAAALVAAVRACYSWAVEQLLEAGVPVDVHQEKSGMTPLHLAAQQGDAEMAQQLLQAGASITAVDSTGRQALAFAVQGRSFSTISALLAAASATGTAAHEIVNAADKQGTTALHLAAALPDNCIVCNMAFVQLLLQAGAEATVADSKEHTPLHKAALHRNAGVVRQLLAAGASVNAAAKCGSTALHKAAQAGDAEIVRLLLAAGATVNTASAMGRTPLHVVMRGHGDEAVGIVQQLLAAGAQVTATDEWDCTPLHYVAGAAGMARLLLQASSVAVGMVDTYDETPLHKAARKGRSDVVQLLLQHGAPVTIVNDDDQTALQVAVYHGHLKVVQVLHTWAPLDADGLRAAIATATETAVYEAGEPSVVSIAVYLLQQLAAVDVAAVPGVLENVLDELDPKDIVFGLVKALHAAIASSDAVAAAHAAATRELAEQRRGVEQLITGLAAMQLQQRQGLLAQQQQGQVQSQEGQPSCFRKQGQQQDQQQDIDMGGDQGGARVQSGWAAVSGCCYA